MQNLKMNPLITLFINCRPAVYGGLLNQQQFYLCIVVLRLPLSLALEQNAGFWFLLREHRVVGSYFLVMTIASRRGMYNSYVRAYMYVCVCACSKFVDFKPVVNKTLTKVLISSLVAGFSLTVNCTGNDYRCIIF